MRISDWSSDVCSSDLRIDGKTTGRACRICPAKHTASRSPAAQGKRLRLIAFRGGVPVQCQDEGGCVSIGSDHLRRPEMLRSEEHTSELQSLMRISYAVFCLKKKTNSSITTHKQ